MMDIPREERILMGLFFYSNESNEILENLKPEWNDKVELQLEQKLSIFDFPFLISDVFPWKKELSEGVDDEKFCGSFFIQPDLFLRLRPGNEEKVKVKLENAGIDFKVISGNCIALSNSSKIDTIIELNREAVVQDHNSQQTGELFLNYKPQTANPKLSLWDCCAASGGKSIMAKDILGDIDLTVSDIRESILINLKKRFKEAGIINYKSFVADLTDPKFKIQNSKFDIILCDAPCTGSGTWSRTPEQLFYFDENEIEEYAVKQKKIVSNIIPALKPGGHLIYITCSVFKKENEAVVEFIEKEFQLKQIKTDVLKGYHKKADTMFAALLRKPL